MNILWLALEHIKCSITIECCIKKTWTKTKDRIIQLKIKALPLSIDYMFQEKRRISGISTRFNLWEIFEELLDSVKFVIYDCNYDLMDSILDWLVFTPSLIKYSRRVFLGFSLLSKFRWLIKPKKTQCIYSL